LTECHDIRSLATARLIGQPMRVEESGLEPGAPHRYDDDDRRAQLRDFGDACRRLADLFAEHADSESARLFAQCAEAAVSLRAATFSHDDLKALAVALPEQPVWLHPKYLDFNGLRVAWQEEAAEQVAVARRAALELRSIATYGAP
jgi:hypothetical protein